MAPWPGRQTQELHIAYDSITENQLILDRL